MTKPSLISWTKEQVLRLKSFCPVLNSKDSYVADQRGQDAVIALGIFFLESDLQYKDELLPYLLGILKGLPTAQWNNLTYGNQNKLPQVECFSFCVNTILCDVALRSDEARDTIIGTQLDVFSKLCQICEKKDAVPKDVLCKYTVPLVLGMARAIGRSSDEHQSLISLLYAPTKYTTPVVSDDRKEGGEKTFTSFRPIFPRTLSSHMITPETPLTPSGLSSSLEYFESHRERSPSPKPLSPTNISTSNPAKEASPDLRDIYFNVWGSSFTKLKPWGFEIVPEHDHLKFKLKHLEKLFDIVKHLLDKDLQKKLNNNLEEVRAETENGYMAKFVYQTYSEVLTLVLITLLRDVMEQEKELSGKFMKEILQFVKKLWTSTYGELEKTHQHVKETGGRYTNTYELLVYSCAACIDLLFWSVREDSDAENLCLQLTEKMSANTEKRLLLSHTPITLVCLESLGKLAVKFPALASTMVSSLRDFLITPSPILSKLNKYANPSARSSITITVTDETRSSQRRASAADKLSKALQNILDCAIMNICRALKAGLTVDPQCVQAFLASVSNRLYRAEMNDRGTSKTAEERWNQLKMVMKFIRPASSGMLKPEDLQRQCYVHFLLK